MRLRYILVVAFALSFILTPWVRRLARVLKVYDYPNRRKIHSRPVALLGGVSVYIAFTLSLAYNAIFSRPLQGIMIAGTLVFIIGLIDDVKKLPVLSRLVAQIVAALILVSYDIRISFFPVTHIGEAAESLLTIVWIVGITNAMNCLDGVDGLAASLGIIVTGCFFLIGYLSDQPWLGGVTIALTGSLLGFLRYNISPAKLFLGDAGSMFIGFILASIALLGNWAADSKVSLLVPVLVLGIPIFDMCLTTVMRVKEGVVRSVKEWLQYAGKDHFHHRLIDLGFGPRGIVALMSALSLSLGLSGVVLKDSDIGDAVLLLIQAAILFIIIALLMIVGARERRKKPIR